MGPLRVALLRSLRRRSKTGLSSRIVEPDTIARPSQGSTPDNPGAVNAISGAALYVGSLIGPGVLLIPALALRAAGPASIISWGIMIVVSAPLALTFAALGIRMPVAGGVAEYVRTGFGQIAGLVTGGWFLTAVLVGAPTVAVMGGFYVADLTRGGTPTAGAVALVIFVSVLCGNWVGLRLSARVQLLAASVLTVLIAIAVATALPVEGSGHWSPFAPHGWWAIGTAANLLVWLFVGWESVAQLAGEFERPAVQLPRAMALAFGVVTVLYCGLALATISLGAPGSSRVPLADLMSVGLGQTGRHATAVLAVALTMATMNVYVASAAKLASSLSEFDVLPRWLAVGGHRSVPRRPLLVIGVAGLLLIGGMSAAQVSPAVLVKATSACFIAVYLATTCSAVRILRGRARIAATGAAAVVITIASFSGWYLLVPAASASFFIAVRRRRVARE